MQAFFGVYPQKRSPVWCFMFAFIVKTNGIELMIKCMENDFLCMDGTQCVSKSFLCDGESDCRDHSDELICAKGAETCTHPEEFQCHNGECIPRQWVSDRGPPDCIDGTDEIDVVEYCARGRDRFLCDNELQCVPAQFLCDSVQQCVDGSDEVGCEIACKFHNCSHACRPTPAGGVCSCPPGYTLTNGSLCIDKDECSVEGKSPCEQLCTNTNGSFQCGCKDGFQLQEDKQSCLKVENKTEILKEASVQLLVAGTQGIFSVNVQYIDGTSSDDHVRSHITGSSQLLLARDADALAYDPVTDKIIFHDVLRATIRSLSLQEHEIKDLYSDVVQLEGLALDVVTQNLYWTSYLGFLFVGKLDGSGSLKLIKEGLQRPRGIAVDSERSFLYLTDWGHNSRILRCFLDGTDCLTVVYLTGHPNFIAIDPVQTSHAKGRNIYWTDSRKNGIWRLTDGETQSGHIKLTNSKNPHPFSLAVTKDIIFYTDLNTFELHGILRSSRASIYDLNLGPGSFYDVLVLDRNYTLPARNDCSSNNGGCSHFCFPRPNKQFRCLCSATYHLAADNKTCKEMRVKENNQDMKRNESANQVMGNKLIMTGKGLNKKAAEEKENKIWILGVVLAVAVIIGVILLVVLLYIRKSRGKTFPVPKIFRYNKDDEEFQELVCNDALSSVDHQNNNKKTTMACCHLSEVSVISADSAFVDARTDMNSNPSINSFTA